MLTIVLSSLRAAASKDTEQDGWCDVYLDNAKPANITDKQFRSCLALLAGRNQYKVIDGYAWGKVKMS